MQPPNAAPSYAHRLGRLLYSALYLPLAPLIVALLATRRDSRARWREYVSPRLPLEPDSRRPLWLHAVSVGEVLSAWPVVKELAGRLGDPPLFLTSTIEDALELGARQDPAPRARRFLPLDLMALQGPFLERLAPRATLLSETDFWPNMIEAHRRSGQPLFLVNGRISYKIHRGFRRLGAFTRGMFDGFTAALVQTGQDRERLLDLGMHEDRIVVTGNTKYEAALAPAPLRFEENEMVGFLARAGRRWIVAGSTHPGEDEPLLDCLKELPADVGLVLVPRRIQRGADLVRAAVARGLESRAWSALGGGAACPRVVVVDRLGVLPHLYDLATLAFVGGSFDGSGGHNFLEAARASCPFFTGPAMRNFHEDVARFAAADAIAQVTEVTEVGAWIHRALGDPQALADRGRRARALLDAHVGAAARTASEIAARLEHQDR